MTRTKRILLSLTLLSVVAALVGLGSAAFFSDTETSTDNTLQAGAIDLLVDFEGYYNKEVDGNPNAGFWELTDLTDQRFFDIEDIKPGDYGEGTISLHVYNNDAWACAQVTPTANDDVSSTEPELEVSDAVEDGQDAWDGELAQNMEFVVWADVCKRLAFEGSNVPPAIPGDNIYQPECDILLTEGNAPTETQTWALADSVNPNVFTGQIEPLTGSKDYYLGVGWRVPGEVGNIVQTDAYQADISFYTEQYRNNPDFACNYTWELDEESLSDQNATNQANAHPYIVWDIQGDQIKLDFVNPTNFQFAFDYRVDGEPGTDNPWSDVVINGGELIGQEIGPSYNIVNVSPLTTETRHVAGNNEILVGLRLGAENDWFLDWIRFYSVAL